MTKQESQILKGVAVLMMVFLHLFYFSDRMSMVQPFIYIGNKPLVNFLSPATYPVPFFLILSGYGMHRIFKRGFDKNRWGRILKIYSHWWLALLIFTSLGVFFNIKPYYVNIQDVLSNYTAFHTTWYTEGWFLLPYMGLTLLSPIIFNFTDKFKPLFVLGTVFLLGLATSFIISKYSNEYLYSYQYLYNIFLVVHLLPSFVFGAMMDRIGVVRLPQNILPQNIMIKSWLLYILLITLVIARCVISSAVVWGPAYACLFILIFLSFKRWTIIDRVLEYFGNHSLNIWLTHTWFCYYLFHDQIYSLKYSIVIYIVVILLSLVSSYLINYILSILGKGYNMIILKYEKKLNCWP